MTDPQIPLSDEELSADLDGQAEPDVRARIAADTGAGARQEQLRAASELVARPVDPLADDVVDSLIAAAVGAAEGSAAGQGTDDVIPIAPLRSRRAHVPPPWLVAAAVIVLVVVGLALVWTGRSSSPRTTTAARTNQSDSSAPPSARPEAQGGATARRVSPAPNAGAQPSAPLSSVGPLTDLGGYASPDALRKALRVRLPPPATTYQQGVPAITPLQVTRCAQVLENSPLGLGQRLQTAMATLAGQPVIVYVYSTSGAGRSAGRRQSTLVVAVGVAACDPRLLFYR